MDDAYRTIDTNDQTIAKLLVDVTQSHPGIHSARLLDRPLADEGSSSLPSSVYLDFTKTHADSSDAVVIGCTMLCDKGVIAMLRRKKQSNLFVAHANHRRIGDMRRDIHRPDIIQPETTLDYLAFNGNTIQKHIAISGSPLESLFNESKAKKALTDFARGGLVEQCKSIQEMIPTARISEILIESEKRQCHISEIAFYPDSLLVLQAGTEIPFEVIRSFAQSLRDDILRHQIGIILREGITTDTTLPADDKAWQAIVDKLKHAGKNNLLALLEIGGFSDHSRGDAGSMEDGEMILRCKECIYFLPKRKWCDLPALPLPVEPEWYCKLWKL
ncbi:hypothetical protein [Litorivivens sp.]|uniref:hypothetical protein n=1 Tax=Litorivivens sp. TaxID=2020868 RepID=UPI00356A004F